jgi:tetratricopeptide (TPR) repeat protein
MSLIKVKEFDKAEEIIKNNINNINNNEGSYLLGLILAGQSKYQEAIEKLRLVTKSDPDNKESKKILFKLLIHQAGIEVNKKDWTKLSSILSLAFELAPDLDTKKELLQFNDIMPISLIKDGNRSKCAELFTGQWEKEPGNIWLLHNTALLYYYWAISDEEDNLNNGRVKPEDPAQLNILWETTIAYWTLIMNYEEYWKSFVSEKQKLWDVSIEPDIVSNLKNILLTNKLQQSIVNYIDRYKIQNRPDDVLRHQNYLTKLMLEKKSAYYFKEYIYKPNDNDRGSKVNKYNLPGGVLYYSLNKIQDNILNKISEYCKTDPVNEKLGILKILFSNGELGRLFIIAEDLNDPCRAFEELQKNYGNISKIGNKQEEFIYTCALIYLLKGNLHSDTDQILKAFECWESSQSLLMEYYKSNQPKILDNLLKSLENKLKENIVEKTIQDAKRKNQSQKTTDAINVLERGRTLVKSENLDEHLAILYCEEGFKKLDGNKYLEARKEFEKAISIVPGYERARKGIGTSYNNEGVAITNMDKKIELFEKARTYDSVNNVFCENLAGAYNSKAVSILNSMSNYSSYTVCDTPISLLKKGLKMLNSNLDVESLMNSLPYTDEYTFNNSVKSLPDDLYKLMLRNFWIAVKSRKNLRGY